MVLESIMNMVLESTRNMVLEENCICVEVPQLAIQSGARIPTTPLNTFEYIWVHPNTSEYNQWKTIEVKCESFAIPLFWKIHSNMG